MHSSTSHSKFRLPRRALLLVVTALAAAFLCGLYTVRWNPEVRFFRDAYAIKSAWAERIENAYSNKVIFYGGSSCDTSIDPERLLNRHGIPAANFGLGAGMGATMLTRMAMSHARPGDTLVVALEPTLLADPNEVPSLAAQFAAAQKHIEWLKPLNAEPISPAQIALELRPGGYHTFTLLGKLLLGRPLYRYNRFEMHPGGWHEVRTRLPITSVDAEEPQLTPAGRVFLGTLAAWGRTNNVRVLYSIPRAFVTPQEAPRFRRANGRWLLDVMEVIPVLKDEALGVDDDATHFADMNFHPNRTGAELRTDAIGLALQHSEYWSRAELESAASR